MADEVDMKKVAELGRVNGEQGSLQGRVLQHVYMCGDVF